MPHLHIALAAMDFLEVHGMRESPHPPYSSDLALPDFHFFDHLKHYLEGVSFVDAGKFLQALGNVVNEN
jgi:hypothetical protein